MRNRILGVTLGGILTLGTSAAALANTHANHADHREQRQDARIQHGLASGKLSAGEDKRLDAREARIAQQEAADKASGDITRRDRRHLNNELKRTSQRIRREKY